MDKNFKIAVIGSGTMGNGIAHVCAQSGFNTLLVDINQAQLNKALSNKDKESRTEPSEALAISFNAESDIFPFSFFEIFFKFSNKIEIGTRCKSNL